MNDKTVVVILKHTDYRENDIILQTFSAEYGKLSFIARGLKKMTSKNAAACQLFMLSEVTFDYVKNDYLHILKSANVVDSFRLLREDLNLLSIMSVLAEITQQIELTSEDYQLIINTMERMVNAPDYALIALNLFLSEVVAKQGNSPMADGCVVCGSTNEICSVSITEGGFVCKQCNQRLRLPTLATEDLQGFRYITKAGFKQYDLITANIETNSLVITRLLLGFLNEHSGITCKSFRFLENYLQNL